MALLRQLLPILPGYKMNQLNQIAKPTLTDLLNVTKENTGNDLNCVQIGIIHAFYPDKQTADIQFALQRVKSIAPDGTRTLVQLPLLLNCPTMTLFGGNAFLSMPVQAGDNCIVLFNDRELGEWHNNGGVQTPITYRTHDLSDAIAIVGIRNLQNTIADYIANGVRLSYNENSRITITDQNVATIANLFKHTGNMEVTGNLTVDGNAQVKGGLEVDGTVTGSSGTLNVNANVTLSSGKTLSAPIVSAGNGASGSFANVTVVNGIVTAGS